MARRELMAKYLAEMLANPEDKRHGTSAGYDYGCRCDACRAAGRAQSRPSKKDIEELAEGIRRYRKWILFGGNPGSWVTWTPPRE